MPDIDIMSSDDTPSPIEQSILSNAGFEPDANDDQSTGTQDADPQDNVRRNDPKAQRQDAATTEDEPGSTQRREDSASDGRSRQQGERSIPSRRYTDYDYDEQGNVIDPKSRRVLYEAGSDANTMFRQLRNTQFQAAQAQRKLEEATRLGRQFEMQANAFQEANTVARDAKLSPTDQAAAMKIFAAYRTNPVQTLRALLTEAQASGTDLSEILDNVSSIQTDAIQRLIDSKLAPLTEERTARAQQDRHVADARAQLDTFLEEYPEAEQNLDALVKVIENGKAQGRTLSLPEAWSALLTWATRNNYDIRRPLTEQVQRPRQQQRREPMPRGRNGQQYVSRDEARPRIDRSTRDIVKEAMMEGGIEFNQPDESY